MAISFPVSIQTRSVSNGPQKVVYYPEAISMENPQFQYMINKAIVQQVQELVHKQVEEMSTPIVEMIGTYELKNNQRQVLSLTMTNYAYHYHAANGMTYMKSLTFDLKEEKQCTLKDLFKPGSNYIQRLSELIHLQIKQRDIPVIDNFTTIQPNQDFYVADKTVVIYFQLFELTAHAFGFPIFPISVYDIQDIINENGPLGRLAENN